MDIAAKEETSSDQIYAGILAILPALLNALFYFAMQERVFYLRLSLLSPIKTQYLKICLAF